jgi:glucose/arabinose dehydrogenase
VFRLPTASAPHVPWFRRAAVASSLGFLAACGETSAAIPDLTHDDSTGTTLAVVEVVTGLQGPVYLTAPAGDARLFVVEQVGRIRIVRDGHLVPEPFLDLTTRVQAGGERGLLSMAFHPAYDVNGYFYVDYTDAAGDTRVERYRVSSDPDRADPASATSILSVEQPYANHNGGHVVFGPDGMLYVALGDGGSGGDPFGSGQDPSTLLGAVLRLDVDGGVPYAVPPDNPFAGDDRLRGEIWAFGLRNPWRIAFDPAEDLLYIADVGQNAWEEVNVQPAASAAVNYGWNVMEGAHCYAAPTCDRTGLTRPAAEYGRRDGDCSVIGGYVYRGAAIPGVRGHYFYSDYCGGWLRSFRYVGGTVTDMRRWAVGDLGAVLSFGRDASGELYVLNQRGTVYRIVAAN